MATIRRKRLENFKVMTDWNRLESKHSVRKICRIEKTLTSLFFPCIFKRYRNGIEHEMGFDY